MVYHTPEAVENDPDVWFRAAYYEVPLETAVRAQKDGKVAVEGLTMVATNEGLEIHKVLPGSGVMVDILAGRTEIRGTVSKPGEINSHRDLAGERVIDMFRTCGSIVGLEFIDSHNSAA